MQSQCPWELWSQVKSVRWKSHCHWSLLGQPWVTKGLQKGKCLHIQSFSWYTEWILRKRAEKNAEADDGYNKLVLLEICSIGAEGLSHLFLLMLQCKHINLMLHQPWLLLGSGNINLQQNSSAATFSNITVKAVACGKQVPSF